MRRRKSFLACLAAAACAVAIIAGLAAREFLQQPTLSDLSEFERHWLPLNERAYTVSDWTGKVVFINFWGSWCPPCVKEMPLLDRYDQRYGGDGFQVVGFAVDRPEDAIRFLTENDIKFASMIGSDMTAIDEMLVLLKNPQRVLPYSVVFDSSGSVHRYYRGEVSEQDMDEITEKLLN